MDVKEAIAASKRYVEDIYREEGIADVELEEVEHLPDHARWQVTLAFSRPWRTPRTRAQEILEALDARAGLRRTTKIVTLTDDGSVLSVKSTARVPAST